MRYVPALLASVVLWAVCTDRAAALDVADSATAIEVRTAHYVASISKQEGGVLKSLRSVPDGCELVRDFRIYTDVGLYPERGYVGTRNETEPRIELSRTTDSVTVTSSGVLKGERAAGHQPIRYRLVYRFDASPRIAIESEVTPFATEGAVRAFMATCFAVPGMTEWAVNTIDGVIREDRQDGPQRSYEASRTWIDPHRPEVGFMAEGASLLATGIGAEGSGELQNIIIHGSSFFLAWLAGPAIQVRNEPYRVTFELVVGTGDPMRTGFGGAGE